MKMCPLLYIVIIINLGKLFLLSGFLSHLFGDIVWLSICVMICL